MKNIFVPLGFLLISAGFLTWLVKNHAGNFRLIFSPANRDLVGRIEGQQKTTSSLVKRQTEPVSSPLHLPPGLAISVFAKNLGQVRVLKFSPGGTLLASILNQGKVLALPDLNRDGKADEIVNILTGLNKPHGFDFFQGKLFVAEETKVSRYFWDEQNLSARLDKVLFSLPGGGRHFTRSLAFDKDGRLFVSIGSSCDVCQEKDERLAAVLVSDADGTNPSVFARGLRNAVFIIVNPQTNDLWGTEMGRDFLGDNLPPDEINIIEKGKNYGWPICYGRRVHDTKFDRNVYKRNPCEAELSEPPIYEITAHSAPLGLAFINSPIFPSDWQGDLLVSCHGSWNRSSPIGYKVVRMKVRGDKILGEEDFLTGFLPSDTSLLSGPEQALGRPVDLIFDRAGRLFLSDDKAGVVYLITRE